MEQDRILRLDEKTAGKIAAGEVVERPAMVIKELVENAIDAGATEIIVDIKKGGKAYIKVTDNGSGIYSDDLSLVFERHATSKIRFIEDLNKTQTLGFRGEALASICAVSSVELITMRRGEKSGVKVLASGGTIHKVSEVGTIQGTTLIVRDLFYNTPARLKFLKTDQVEARAITELMGYLALSHPEVGFKYTADEKLIFHTQGKGNLANAIFSVFDPALLKGLYEISDIHERLKIRGFISKFDYTKGTKSYQLTFVNGRYVKSELIKEVIGLAYKPYMMNNRYPVCILFLELPQNEIDVNIHPAKTEIKFHDDGTIKQFIYSALKKSFNLYNQIPDAIFTEREVFTVKTQPEPEAAIDFSENKRDEQKSASQLPFQYSKNINKSDKADSNINLGQVDFSSLSEFANTYVCENIPISIQSNASMYDDLIYIGTYNKTYLLYEKESQLYLIDQHAAHEKILFEDFMDAFERREIHSQVLLIPEVIELGILEMSRFEDVNKVLEQMGFTADIFGDNSIVIREIPNMFDISLARRMVQALFENIKSEVDAQMHHMIAEKACKAAIRAHDHVHQEEQIALLDQLKKLKAPYTCPHGRPIIIRFSLGEIERKFKRIL